MIKEQVLSIWGALASRLSLGAIAYGAAGLNLAILPIFTGALGAAQFGTYVFWLALINWICFIVTLGTPTQLRVKLARAQNAQDSRDEVGDFFGYLLIAYLVILPILVFGLQGFSTPPLEIFLVTLGAFLLSVQTLSNTINLAVKNYALYAMNTAVYMVLPMLLFISSDAIGIGGGSVYALVAVMTTLFGLIAFNIYRNRNVFFFHFISVSKLLEISRSSIRISPNSFLDKLYNQADKIVVGLVWGAHDLGIYAIGILLANGIAIAIRSSNLVSEAAVLKNNARRHIVILSSLLVTVVVALAGYVIITLFIAPILFPGQFEFVSYFHWMLAGCSMRSLGGLVFIADLARGEATANMLRQYGTAALTVPMMVLSIMNRDINLFVLAVAIGPIVATGLNIRAISRLKGS